MKRGVNGRTDPSSVGDGANNVWRMEGEKGVTRPLSENRRRATSQCPQ